MMSMLFSPMDDASASLLPCVVLDSSSCSPSTDSSVADGFFLMSPTATATPTVANTVGQQTPAPPLAPFAFKAAAMAGYRHSNPFLLEGFTLDCAASPSRKRKELDSPSDAPLVDLKKQKRSRGSLLKVDIPRNASFSSLASAFSSSCDESATPTAGPTPISPLLALMQQQRHAGSPILSSVSASPVSVPTVSVIRSKESRAARKARKLEKLQRSIAQLEAQLRETQEAETEARNRAEFLAREARCRQVDASASPSASSVMASMPPLSPRIERDESNESCHTATVGSGRSTPIMAPTGVVSASDSEDANVQSSASSFVFQHASDRLSQLMRIESSASALSSFFAGGVCGSLPGVDAALTFVEHVLLPAGGASADQLHALHALAEEQRYDNMRDEQEWNDNLRAFEQAIVKQSHAQQQAIRMAAHANAY